MNVLFLCLVCGICSGIVLILLFWPKKNRRLLTGLYILYITVIACLKQVFLTSAAGYYLYFLFFFAFLYLMTRYFSGRSRNETIRGIAVFLFLNILGEMMAFSWLKLSGQTGISDWSEAGARAPVLISNFSQLLLAALLSLRRQRQKKEMKEEGLFLLLHAALLMLCVIACVVSWNAQESVQTELTALQGTTVLIMAVFYLIWVRRAELCRAQRRLAELRRRNEESFLHYQRLEQVYENLHRLRHDFANLMQMAQAAAKRGDTVLAGELLDRAGELAKGLSDEKDSDGDSAAAGRSHGGGSLGTGRQ